MQVAGDHDLVATRVNVGHHRRLRDRCGAVVEGCVRDVERGQLGDQGLELEDGLKRALARLRLVWGVRGIELRFRGDGGHGRGNEPAIDAAAPKGQPVGENSIPRRERRDLVHRLVL